MGDGSELQIRTHRHGPATMMPETAVVLSAVSTVVGVVLGEIVDVWYDLTHAEAVVEPDRIIEAAQFAPKRPLAFGYAKVYFREVLFTPDAFEHYHWGCHGHIPE